MVTKKTNAILYNQKTTAYAVVSIVTMYIYLIKQLSAL